MFATPRILVLGDSVTWGQGLRADQKMHSLLADMLYAQNGVEPQTFHYAHSGGTIGYENGVPTKPVAVQDWWPREIPRANPTLHEQCALVAQRHRDQRFDYVILSAGINDVSVMTIFNPRTSEDDIRSRTKTYCHDQMSFLLDELHAQFVSANPAVRIFVLGYYPVLTNESAIPSLAAVVKALARETINPPRPHGLAETQWNIDWDLRGTLIRNSIAFRDASRDGLSSAVAEVNEKFSVQNFTFVDPLLSNDEAAFAPKALLWGLRPGTEVSTDPIYDDRIKYCVDVVKEPIGVDQFTCERASLGHPNVGGAMRYAQRLFAAITPVPAPQATASTQPTSSQ